MSDVSQSSGVFAMELCYESWYRNFGGGLPGIMFVAISLPFNEVLEPSLVPTTVEYLLYFPLCFSINDYGQWVVFRFSSWNWVVWSRSELYYVKHWMELLHPVWQLWAVGHRSDPVLHYKGAKPLMREFLQRTHSPDIQCVEEDFVARVEYWSQSFALVIIPFYVVLCLVDRELRFFVCCSYPLHKLVDCFQTRRVLSGFKAYARKLSGIEQERRLLGSEVDVVVVLELRHR